MARYIGRGCLGGRWPRGSESGGLESHIPNGKGFPQMHPTNFTDDAPRNIQRGTQASVLYQFQSALRSVDTIPGVTRMTLILSGPLSMQASRILALVASRRS